VEIKNLRVSKIHSAAIILKTAGYIVVYLLILLVIYQFFLLRFTIGEKLTKFYEIAASSKFLKNLENPREIFLLLFSGYCLSVIFRFAVSLLLEVPLIASDELSYRNMAYGFFQTGNFYSTEQYFAKVDIPNVLYSFLISLSFFFKENFFIAIKLINSLIINLAVLPSYLIAREFSSPKRATVVALLVLLLPTMNYTNFAMTESLYFTVFMFCFFLVFKSLTTKTAIHNVFAGIFMALLLLTKVNAVAFFLAYLLVIVFMLFSFRNSKKVLLEHVLSCIFTVGVFIITFFILNFMLKGNFSYEFGLYGEVVKGNLGDEIFSIPFLSMAIAHLSTLSYLFLVPFVVAISSTVQSYQNKDYKRLFFLVFGILLFLGHLAMVLKLTIDISGAENFKRLHARYYFMTLPFFIILFVSFCDKLTWNKPIKITLLSSFFLFTFANIFYVFPEYANHGLLIVDNPFLAWFLFKGKKIIIFISIFALMTIIYYIKSPRKHYLPYILFFIIKCGNEE